VKRRQIWLNLFYRCVCILYVFFHRKRMPNLCVRNKNRLFKMFPMPWSKGSQKLFDEPLACILRMSAVLAVWREYTEWVDFGVPTLSLLVRIRIFRFKENIIILLTTYGISVTYLSWNPRPPTHPLDIVAYNIGRYRAVPLPTTYLYIQKSNCWLKCQNIIF